MVVDGGGGFRTEGPGVWQVLQDAGHPRDTLLQLQEFIAPQSNKKASSPFFSMHNRKAQIMKCVRVMYHAHSLRAPALSRGICFL